MNFFVIEPFFTLILLPVFVIFRYLAAAPVFKKKKHAAEKLTRPGFDGRNWRLVYFPYISEHDVFIV